eukprot:202308_1
MSSKPQPTIQVPKERDPDSKDAPSTPGDEVDISMQDLRNVFNIFDRKKTGKIEAEGIRNVLDDLGIQPPTDEVLNDKLATLRRRVIPGRKQTELSFKDFCAIMEPTGPEAAEAPTYMDILQSFQLISTPTVTGKTIVKSSLLRRHMISLGMNPSKDEFAALTRAYSHGTGVSSAFDAEAVARLMTFSRADGNPRGHSFVVRNKYQLSQ